jgi:uncharacterized protein (TIGR00369 family)
MIDSEIEDNVRRMFERARFVQHLGITLSRLEPGVCECTLTPREEHLQQHGFVHAGVIATLADHTAGGAATTAIPKDRAVLSSSFNLLLMRPALGPLRCRAEVLRAGKTVVYTEASVHAGSPEKLVAKMQISLAVVSQQP